MFSVVMVHLMLFNFSLKDHKCQPGGGGVDEKLEGHLSHSGF